MYNPIPWQGIFIMTPEAKIKDRIRHENQIFPFSPLCLPELPINPTPRAVAGCTPKFRPCRLLAPENRAWLFRRPETRQNENLAGFRAKSSYPQGTRQKRVGEIIVNHELSKG
jgi:hypothetical protein